MLKTPTVRLYVRERGGNRNFYPAPRNPDLAACYWLRYEKDGKQKWQRVGHYDLVAREKLLLERRLLAHAQLLAVLIKKCLDVDLCEETYRVLRTVNGDPYNRPGIIGEKARQVVVKQDGTLSQREGQVPKAVMEAYGGKADMLGHYYRPIPPRPGASKCGPTAWTLRKPQLYAEALKFISTINDIYKAHCLRVWFMVCATDAGNISLRSASRTCPQPPERLVFVSRWSWRSFRLAGASAKSAPRGFQSVVVKDRVRDGGITGKDSSRNQGWGNFN